MFKKILMTALIIVLMLAPGFPPAIAQDTGTEIGAGPPGQTSIEMIGQIDQELFTVTVYGYVTSANNIVSDLLFVEGTNPLDRSEAGARLTFSGTGVSAARSVHENIFTANIPAATITFYWHDISSGISWDDPSSFTTGVPVATMSARLYSILNVQQPDVGVLMVTADGTWDSASPFDVNGTPYQLGHVGLIHHFTFFGQGFRSSEEPLAARYLFAGTGVVVGGGQ